VIYQKVIEYCQKNNLSVNAFEKMCGIGNGTVGRWKDNSSTPTLSTVKKIADSTKTSIKKWIE
jgi:transcriptional regulator with XRE-family HTH domain